MFYNWMGWWPMMGQYQTGVTGYGLLQLQWFVVWALLVALLVAAVRWLWKKGDKK